MTPEERERRAAEQARRQGYTADDRYDRAIRAVRAGRISHACRVLVSNGAATDHDAAFERKQEKNVH